MQGASKGNAVDRILKKLADEGNAPDFVLCIGDDRSDEDMFIAMEHVTFSPHLPAEVCPLPLQLISLYCKPKTFAARNRHTDVACSCTLGCARRQLIHILILHAASTLHPTGIVVRVILMSWDPGSTAWAMCLLCTRQQLFCGLAFLLCCWILMRYQHIVSDPCNSL